MDLFVAIRCSGNVISESVISNGRPLWFHYSGFQAVLTEPLPSNGHIRHSLLISHRNTRFYIPKDKPLLRIILQSIHLRLSLQQQIFGYN
jgi:hypothetical protein